MRAKLSHRYTSLSSGFAYDGTCVVISVWSWIQNPSAMEFFGGIPIMLTASHDITHRPLIDRGRRIDQLHPTARIKFWENRHLCGN